jgi:hypothetical protein
VAGGVLNIEKSFFANNAHGALCDALSLASSSASGELKASYINRLRPYILVA